MLILSDGVEPCVQFVCAQSLVLGELASWGLVMPCNSAGAGGSVKCQYIFKGNATLASRPGAALRSKRGSGIIPIATLVLARQQPFLLFF